MTPFDAILLVSFGGPEGPDDVMPFLRNVTRGRGVPDERLAAVSEHYNARGGVSPINGHCRLLLASLEAELRGRGVTLPLYWGNRNWHPLLSSTMQTMADDGVQHALALATSAYSSYSSCRQYHEDIEGAMALVGAESPTVDKVTQFYDLDGFLTANLEAVRTALTEVPQGSPIAFTAHSIPLTMAETSDYERQLRSVAETLANAVGVTSWDLVFQSRSGPPQVPWLEPDICDHIDALAQSNAPGVVVAPIGFISDHMEVIHDLDTDAADRAQRHGLAFARAATAGTHPAFIEGLADMIEARLLIGRIDNGLRGGSCAVDCCPRPQRPQQSS